MGLLDSLFGSKPSVPTLPQLNLGQEAGKAIAATQANLPAAEKLVSAENLFSQQQIDQMLNAEIPGYSNIKGQVSSNIQSELQGQIPPDVQAAIQNSAAAKSLGSGTAGSGFSKDLVARDLGLTSLQLTDKGLLSAESWIAQAASIYEPSMASVKSYAITPEQQASFDVEERNAQWERNWLSSQISAMPDPVLNSIYQGIHQAGMAAIGAFSGGRGGGGGGSSQVVDPYAAGSLPQGNLPTTLNWDPNVSNPFGEDFNFGAQVSGADAALASLDTSMSDEFGGGNNVNISTAWGQPSMGDQLAGLWGP